MPHTQNRRYISATWLAPALEVAAGASAAPSVRLQVLSIATVRPAGTADPILHRTTASMYLYLFFTVFILPTRTTIAIPTDYFAREQSPSNDGHEAKPSVGWIDPRINGGRFLDVSHSISLASQTKASTSSRLRDMAMGNRSMSSSQPIQTLSSSPSLVSTPTPSKLPCLFPRTVPLTYTLNRPDPLASRKSA